MRFFLKIKTPLTLKTSSFDSFTGGGTVGDDNDDVLLRFLLSPTIFCYFGPSCSISICKLIFPANLQNFCFEATLQNALLDILMLNIIPLQLVKRAKDYCVLKLNLFSQKIFIEKL